MDLVTLAPRASAEERAAVDGVLGTATSRWEGGDRDVPADDRFSRGGHAARARRDLLLPVFHAIQARVGWISQPALEYACRRLTVPPAEAYGVAAFYQMFATTPRPTVVAHVCEDVACRLNGSEDVCSDLERLLGPAGTPAFDGGATWLRTPCLGRCERGPTALFTVAGLVPETIAVAPVDAAAVVEELERAVVGREIVPPRLPAIPSDEHLEHVRRSIPQAGDPGLRLLRRVGVTNPRSLDDYLASGGYRGLRTALDIGPATVIAEVTASRLLGRGGAAFPTGRKWAAVAAQPARPHYVVCNADESEPGTFKDRVLMEEDPFAIIEAMTIEGFATGAERGLPLPAGRVPAVGGPDGGGDRNRPRGGPPGRRTSSAPGSPSTSRSAAAPARTSAARRRPSSSRSRASAASRATSRPSRSRSASSASRRRSTTSRRSSTSRGSSPTAGRPSPRSAPKGAPAPKLFCLSGAVERPGVYELDFGATLGELLALAGGVRGGARLKAVLLGGAAGVFVGPDALDLPLTFEATRAAGATLGSGVVMVFDEGVDLVGTLLRIAAFFRDESCGQCVPCRIGTVRQEELLARLAAGRPLREPGRRAGAPGRPRSGDCATRASAVSARRRRRRSSRRSGRGWSTSARSPRGARARWEAGRELGPRPHLLRAAGPPDANPGTSGRGAAARGRADPRRPHRQRPRRLDDPRRLPRPGDRRPDAVLPREPHARQRLPRLRRRGHGEPRPRAGLLSPRRAGDGGPDRVRACSPQPADGPRAPRLGGRPLARAGRRRHDGRVRRRSGPLRPAGPTLRGRRHRGPPPRPPRAPGGGISQRPSPDR